MLWVAIRQHVPRAGSHAQHPKDSAHPPFVLVAGGFVRQQRGLEDQRPCDGGSLLLAGHPFFAITSCGKLARGPSMR